jgi:dihydrofolate synthase/folylpolyglutamate synthase
MRDNFGADKKDPSFFLHRTRYFLELIGSPHKGFKYIHVTGTAGKGTVTSMIHNSISESGKKVGIYTSPYVTTTIEKFKVNDLYISPKEFVSIVEHLKPFIKQADEYGPYGAPSAFEICLAIACIYFKRQQCEYVVLEVGLGGRYDATNVIENPLVTAITNIDYDHTEILGKTLQSIAYDKAGIIKEGSAFYTSEQRPLLRTLFKKICKEKKASFNGIPKQKTYMGYNIKLVTEICKYIGIPDVDILNGIKKTKLPCRFEIVEQKPLIILDGAHNRVKIASTVSNIKKIKSTFDKLIVITAISDTKKDNTAILKPLASIADSFIVTSLQGSGRKSVHPQTLLPYINKFKKKKASVEIVMDTHEALKKAKKMAMKRDCILVSGSFFLSGEIRKEWYSEDWVLKNRKSFN